MPQHVTFRCSDRLAGRLDAAARKLGISKTALVLQALQIQLDALKHPQPLKGATNHARTKP